MKFHKIRKKDGISSRAKCIVCIFYIVLALLLDSCGTKEIADDPQKEEPSTFTEINQPTESTEWVLYPIRCDVGSHEAEEIQSKCYEIALLCNDLMANGETETSIYFPYDTALTQSAIDTVEQLLADAGYPVMNSDSIYPEYLENSDGLKHFWELANKGENGQQCIITVSSNNAIYYYTFQYSDGKMYSINASIAWDEDGQFTISEPYKIELLDWGMTYNGYFYYQSLPLDRHWTACLPIRLEPTDKSTYDLYEKFLTPVGYPSSVFTLDWDESNYENICFNDLLEPLYREQYNDFVYANEYEYYPDLKSCLIPASIFESTILPHFDISLEEFRISTLYLSDKNAYPWQEPNCSNLLYCPTLTPEVIECRDNEDGTFTMVVEVLCFDYKCFPMFTHEITIRPGSDDGFKYVANQITFVGEEGVPDTTPRLEAQRK